MRIRTIKPGMLVALKTAVRGGVEYQRTELVPDHETEDGQRVAEWKTSRVIRDAEDFAQAQKLRSKCRSIIQAACTPSDFGLLCPAADEGRLDAAIQEADTLAAAFNQVAKTTSIIIRVLKGRVAEDDAEAIRAINGEIRELLTEMEDGVKAADPAAIREAAAKAKRLGAMLSGEANGKVRAAIEEARKAAREIVRRVEKSGELAETVVSELKTEALESARFAFLDIDQEQPELNESAPAEETLPAVNPRDLDLPWEPDLTDGDRDLADTTNLPLSTPPAAEPPAFEI